MVGLPGHCALAGPGPDLHWHDRARPDREAARLVDPGPGNRCAGRADGGFTLKVVVALGGTIT
jgi:hypothetical protein